MKVDTLWNLINCTKFQNQKSVISWIIIIIKNPAMNLFWYDTTPHHVLGLPNVSKKNINWSLSQGRIHWVGVAGGGCYLLASTTPEVKKDLPCPPPSKKMYTKAVQIFITKKKFCCWISKRLYQCHKQVDIDKA